MYNLYHLTNIWLLYHIVVNTFEEICACKTKSCRIAQIAKRYVPVQTAETRSITKDQTKNPRFETALTQLPPNVHPRVVNLKHDTR